MKVRNATGRTDGNSGYTRVFGNEELGCLVSKVQATVISNGTELERILVERCEVVDNIENFIDEVEIGNATDGVYLCQKKILKKSNRYQVEGIKGIEPDLLIFVIQQRRLCKVIELKDGDAFDTKKALGEKEHLEEFSRTFGAMIPFTTSYYICCFNQEDKELIKSGFKNVFDLEHIMTGSELCAILGIDINEIKRIRTMDAEDNIQYFIDELLKIDLVKEEILKRL